MLSLLVCYTKGPIMLPAMFNELGTRSLKFWGEYMLRVLQIRALRKIFIPERETGENRILSSPIGYRL
jgi:hypothetical protein